MYKDISFIIPTARPYNNFASIVVNKLKEILSFTDYSYEFLIYSKENPKDDIIWIEEKENGTSVKGYNESFLISKGKYIYVLNDKWLPNNKILKAIPFLESESFKNRRFKVTTINVHETFNYNSTDMPILQGNMSKQHLLPKELLHPRFLEKNHRYAVFGFPVFERETVKNYLCNHLLNPRFTHHFADNWISFFIGEHGEFPLVVEDSYMDLFGGASLQADDSQDFNTFCDLAKNLINKINMNYV